MADATLHAEFTPYGGYGGVDSAGHMIVGPRIGASFTYGRDTFTVFDPATSEADTYGVTLPVTWNESGSGCGWNGGVAIPASSFGASTSIATYVVVAFADGTYDVLDPGVSWGAHAYCVNLGSKLLLIRSGTGGVDNQPRVFDPATLTWTDVGSAAVVAQTTPFLSGSLLWFVSFGPLRGVNPTTGATVTTYASKDSATSNYMRTADLVDGRYWWFNANDSLQGVRLSDGDTVTIAVTSGGFGPVCADDDGKLWIPKATAGLCVDPATSSIVTHNHGSSIGDAFSIFASGGRVWAPFTNPTS